MAEEIPVAEVIRVTFETGMALKNQGNQIEALKKFDEAQQLIKQEYGDNSDQLDQVYNEIAIVCNVLSMAHLQKEDYRLC